MNGNIYILQAALKSIHVYRMEDKCWQKEITRTEFDRPQDIAACSLLSVLFVLDMSRIWAVSKNDQVSAYVRLSEVSATMSITQTHLLVISSEGIRKYDRKPSVKPRASEVRLPEALKKNTKLWHAVETNDGHLVAYIESAKFHRVSKITDSRRDKSKVEVFTYGKEVGPGEDQLSSPVYLAVEPSNGHIFVADHDNGRVVVLDGNLNRVFTIADLPEACYPTRLCYVEESGLLLVGMSNGLVVGYKFRR